MAGYFVRVLTEPDASLCRQYQALLATEGVEVEFLPEGVRRLAEVAFEVNQKTENIGTRRLHTVMEGCSTACPSRPSIAAAAACASTPTTSSARSACWRATRTCRATSCRALELRA